MTGKDEVRRPPSADRPQITARLASVRKRQQLAKIAEELDERDSYGYGVNVVIRRAVDRYIARHRDLLPDHLRD